MRYWYFIGLLVLTALTGCDKLRPFELIGGSRAVNPVLLIAGQSNALRFGQYGTRALQLKYPSIKIVNCAVGSTVINNWVVKGPYWEACMTALHGEVPDFVFWMQGENDTYPGDVSQFAQKTTAVFNGFKVLNKDVRIVFSQLGPNNSGIVYPNWQTIQDQQAMIFMPGVIMVTAKDLLTIADGIHLTPESESILGKRVAAEL